MAISKSHGKKAPSQNPVDFFEGKQHGGSPITARNSNQKIGDKLTSGKQREQIFGRKNLSK